MNIQELQSFNLADAAKFHFRLNPKLWGSDENLLPEVKTKLLEIAEDFRQFLGVPELDVKDITISGSNAAYSYTDKSDIDLHLVVEFPKNKNSEIYRELFNAKKFQYNKQYDYKIGDADVELYVQDANEQHHSQGIYSLLGDKWVRVPRRVKADVDDISVKHKYEDWGHKIEQALASNDEQELEQTLKRLKDMRAAGLQTNGEFGVENLTFKLLRNNNLIQQLFDAYHQAKSERLSLEELQNPKPKKKFTYGYSEDVGSTPDGVDASTCQFLSEKDVEEDASSNPNGVSAGTNMFLDDQDNATPEQHLKDFVRYCQKRLGLNEKAVIKLRRDPEWSKRNKTFGRFNPNIGALEVAWGNRHIMDVFRTVAHELTHQRQNEVSMQPEDAGDTGSEWENQANALAGVLMREWGQQHPEMFDSAMIQAQDELDEGALSKAAAALAMSTALGMGNTAQAQSVGDALRAIQNIGTAAKTASGMTRAGINAEAAQELMNYIRAQGGDPHGQNKSTLYQWQKRMEQDRQAREQDSQPVNDKYLNDFRSENNKPARYQHTDVNEGASGYIPTKKQAKDPRYSMALTVDIKPGQVGKEANKLKLKTDSQGHPQIARADGLFEQLMLEYKRLKEEDLDEVKMSPSALEQFANSEAAKGIRAGFEAELIFRDTQGDDNDEGDLEPDYEADERAYSIQQVIEFFENDDYGYGISDRQRNRLEEQLDETYFEWRDEQMMSDFRNDVDDLVREQWLEERPMEERIRAALVDGMELSDEDADRIIAASDKAPVFTRSSDQQEYAQQNKDYELYLQADRIADDILDEDVEQSIEKQDEYYDQALDNYRDNYSGDDDSFFSDVGLRWMSDVAEQYNLDWPYYTGGGRQNEGSRSWEDIGAELQEVIGMPVEVSSSYHSATRKEGQWIIEPDGSLDPDDRSEEMGLEIVSPPMPLLQTIEKLKQLVDWANSPEGGNAYTNSSTGLHMGVSLPVRGGDVDYVKLILFMGDKYVLEKFGRSANTYTASAFNKIKQNLGSQGLYKASADGVIKLLQHGLTELAYKELQKGVGTSKYTSAHLQNGYIEFRSPGGDWLAKADEEIGVLENTMMRFARAMAIAGDPGAERQEYAKKLYKMVTTDNEQYADQLRLFSEYSAGTIDKQQLKKHWAEKTIGKEKRMNQRWKLYQNVNGTWTAVPGAEWNNYSEDQVKNAVWSKYGREALDSGEYKLVNMGEQEWEVYDVKTGQTLEIVKGKSKGEVADAVYDKYAEKGVGFNVRPYEDPAKLTPRAKLAKRIVDPKQNQGNEYEIINRASGQTLDGFRAVTTQQADQLFSDWLKERGLPDDTEDVGYRVKS